MKLFFLILILCSASLALASDPFCGLKESCITSDHETLISELENGIYEVELGTSVYHFNEASLEKNGDSYTLTLVGFSNKNIPQLTFTCKGGNSVEIHHEVLATEDPYNPNAPVWTVQKEDYTCEIPD